MTYRVGNLPEAIRQMEALVTDCQHGLGVEHALTLTARTNLANYRGAAGDYHLGSAHDDIELELLKAAARQRLAAGQGVLDLGLEATEPARRAAGGGPLPIISTTMAACSRPWSTPTRCSGSGCRRRGRGVRPAGAGPDHRADQQAGLAAGAEEAGAAASYRTVTRRLRAYSKDSWRQQISAACAAHAGMGPASLVLFDVSTLYFGTDAEDGFREPGYSKERRLEPPITIGLLTGQHGFPLMVSAFEGNRAETKTMLPVIESFMTAHDLPDVTVVADAGMISEANQKAIEAASLSFILGLRIPHVPYALTQWRREHPGEQIPDGHVFTQPWPAGPNGGRRDQVIYRQHRHDRARRTLRGIDDQVHKAGQAAAGNAPVKRNRFIQLSGGTRSVNRELENKARA